MFCNRHLSNKYLRNLNEKSMEYFIFDIKVQFVISLFDHNIIYYK